MSLEPEAEAEGAVANGATPTTDDDVPGFVGERRRGPSMSQIAWALPKHQRIVSLEPEAEGAVANGATPTTDDDVPGFVGSAVLAPQRVPDRLGAARSTNASCPLEPEAEGAVANVATPTTDDDVPGFVGGAPSRPQRVPDRLGAAPGL